MFVRFFCEGQGSLGSLSEPSWAFLAVIQWLLGPIIDPNQESDRWYDKLAATSRAYRSSFSGYGCSRVSAHVKVPVIFSFVFHRVWDLACLGSPSDLTGFDFQPQSPCQNHLSSPWRREARWWLADGVGQSTAVSQDRLSAGRQALLANAHPPTMCHYVYDGKEKMDWTVNAEQPFLRSCI